MFNKQNNLLYNKKEEKLIIKLMVKQMKNKLDKIYKKVIL